MTISTTQGAYQRDGMSAHYKDLRELYAKRMECHGNGLALMQPMSGEDLWPPCAGFFDRNGDWNLIANLRTAHESSNNEWVPLERTPSKLADVLIEWQPKTALGVSAMTMDTSAESPDNLPAGGEGHIKYSSNNKFGAVLMTMKPVTLHAYNDERLFLQWYDDNKSLLYERYGTELKKYGMWIVTRTYNSQGASINAWLDNKKSAIVSAKAKASMLGEAGNTMGMSDAMTDRDWSHYKAKTSHGLVVFLDGIEVPPMDWWKEGIKLGLFPFPKSQGVKRTSSLSNQGTLTRSRTTGNEYQRPSMEIQSKFLQTPQSNQRPSTLVADFDVLQDAGFKGMNSPGSLHRYSYAPSLQSSNASRSREPSLRRERRSVSRDINLQ